MSSLHPILEAKLTQLIKRMGESGWVVAVQSGYRSIDEQNKLYAQGRTKPGKRVTNAKGGQSYHNFGVAADVVFKVNGKWSWDDKLPWSKLGEEGKAIGLEWGGDWKSIKDRPHFQYTNGLKLDNLNVLYKSGGLKRVWEVIC